MPSNKRTKALVKRASLACLQVPSGPSIAPSSAIEPAPALVTSASAPLASAQGSASASNDGAKKSPAGLDAIDAWLKKELGGVDLLMKPRRVARHEETIASSAGWRHSQAEGVGRRIQARERWLYLRSRILVHLALVGHSAEDEVHKRARLLQEEEALEASASMPALPTHFGASPVAIKDEDARENWQRVGSKFLRGMAFKRPVTPLKTRAARYYSKKAGSAPPPIESSTARFDRNHHANARRANLSLKSLTATPHSDQAYETFQDSIGELFRSRHVLNAPIEPLAKLYPDAVWGISPERLTVATEDRIAQAATKGMRGIEFVETRHTHRGVKIKQMSPLLRTVRPAGAKSAAGGTHKLMPDSHYALANMHSDDATANWKDKDVRWKLYKTVGAADEADAAESGTLAAQLAEEEAERKRREAEEAEKAPPVVIDEFAPGGAKHHLIFGAPSDEELLSAMAAGIDLDALSDGDPWEDLEAAAGDGGGGNGGNTGSGADTTWARKSKGDDPDFWSLVDKGSDGDESLAWLDGSVWRRRKFGPRQADAKDYVDHARCLKSAFRRDWAGTSGAAFVKNQGEGRAFGSTILTCQIVGEVANVLEAWYPLIIRIFTYYSCIGADITNNITGIPLQGFSQLLTDARLDLALRAHDASAALARHAKTRGEDGYDLIWVSVNTTRESLSQEYNSQARFTRGEFLEFIVRSAIDQKTPEEMVSCVRQFCEDLQHFLSGHPDWANQIVHQPDQFRRKYCYTREVDAMLKHHGESLKSLFKIYAERGTGGVDVDGATDLMSAAEWMALMRDIGFIKECGVRNLYLLFAQSRMATIDEQSKKSVQAQLTQLPFEGFLEVHATSAAACGAALTRAVARTTMLCAGTLTIACTPVHPGRLSCGFPSSRPFPPTRR